MYESCIALGEGRVMATDLEDEISRVEMQDRMLQIPQAGSRAEAVVEKYVALAGAEVELAEVGLMTTSGLGEDASAQGASAVGPIYSGSAQDAERAEDVERDVTDVRSSDAFDFRASRYQRKPRNVFDKYAAYTSTPAVAEGAADDAGNDGVVIGVGRLPPDQLKQKMNEAMRPRHTGAGQGGSKASRPAGTWF